MTASLYQLDNVSKHYGRVPAVDRLNLTIPKGSFSAIMGSNGSGKTTLLKLLSSLIKPTSGRIFFNGNQPIPQNKIGYVSHQLLLYNDLTVIQNLQFFAAMYQTSGQPERISEMINHFRLDNFAHRTIRELSRGQQQRVTIARAMLHRPDVLLLDEPYTGLDSVNADFLDSFLKNLHESGINIIFSSHDRNHVQNLTDAIYILKNGTVAEFMSGKAI